jgi:hypothetical protein
MVANSRAFKIPTLSPLATIGFLAVMFLLLAALSRTLKDTTETFEDGICTTCGP